MSSLSSTVGTSASFHTFEKDAIVLEGTEMAEGGVGGEVGDEKGGEGWLLSSANS